MPTLAPPPIDNTLTQKDGTPSGPWARWLQLLWETATAPAETGGDDSLYGTGVFTPGVLASGWVTLGAVAVTGAALGDEVHVTIQGSAGDLVDSAGSTLLGGYVSAADVVTVHLHGAAGSMGDAITVRVRVKPAP